MTLQTELDAFRAAWEGRVGSATASLIAGDIDDLRRSGILDRVAAPGTAFPALTLPDATGKPVDLATLSAASALVVVFYRGGWCPYCNLELRAYQKRLAEFAARGATLVAVSPETPDNALSTIEKNDLAFPVLSDVGGALADALGIRFELSETVLGFYKKAGHDLPARNGDGRWSLPMPATFVVARGGAIKAAFVDPDYRTRMNPDDALAALAA